MPAAAEASEPVLWKWVVTLTPLDSDTHVLLNKAAVDENDYKCLPLTAHK